MGIRKMWYPPNSGGNPQDLLRSQCLIIECLLVYLSVYLFIWLFLVYVWALIFLFFGVCVSLKGSISLKSFKCVYVYVSVYMFVQFLRCMFELWFFCFLVYVFFWKLWFVYVLIFLVYMFQFLFIWTSIFFVWNPGHKS
jgi:hypothetical protein